MYDKLADFGSASVTSGAGAVYALPDEINWGSERNGGLSGAEPSVVVELASADPGASSKYKIDILHGDASGPTAALVSTTTITNPKAGVLAEIPLPRMHRQYMKVKITTSGAAVTANTVTAYLANGGNAGQASMVMPD